MDGKGKLLLLLLSLSVRVSGGERNEGKRGSRMIDSLALLGSGLGLGLGFVGLSSSSRKSLWQ